MSNLYDITTTQILYYIIKELVEMMDILCNPPLRLFLPVNPVLCSPLSLPTFWREWRGAVT